MAKRERIRVPVEWEALPDRTISLPRYDFEAVSEADAKTACAVATLFMVLLSDPKKNPDDWYVACARRAWDYPMGSYRHVFWWALRTCGMAPLPRPEKIAGLVERDVSSLQKYFDWKLEEFRSGRCPSEGVLW